MKSWRNDKMSLWTKPSPNAMKKETKTNSPLGFRWMAWSLTKEDDLCSIYKLILWPRASHLATVKMLKLQFGPRQVQRLPSGAHLPISEPPLWVSWCRRNSRLMLGVWTSKTCHGAGYSDFFSMGSGLLSMRQDSLLWWSESLAQWPSMLSPSVSQSQTRLGLCG